MNLTFQQLRQANIERQIAYIKSGRPSGFINWSLGDWSNAAMGEMGEAANIIKKIRRGDYSLYDGPEVRKALGAELADAIIYIDLLAQHADINLEQAIIDKFNNVSERLGLDIRLEEG